MMVIDTAMRRLSQSANKGRLWLGLAAAGALVPGTTRRAALRGAASLAATSAVTNAAVKPLIRRRRPDIELIPALRRLRKQPGSTSFPSGHAASAAAFTTGVALESPVLGAAIVPLAAAVAYSRVHVGVHHVSDVVAGAALGAGIAMAARRWWPIPAETPARTWDQHAAPALPGGRGLLVFVNPRSGSDDDPTGEISELLPEAHIVELPDHPDLQAGLLSGAELAHTPGGIQALGTAGGDGSVAPVAALAHEHGLPLAVFPSGTLNHFAQDVGIDSFDDVRDAVEAGAAAPVDVAVVSGHAFVNTANIGGYPEMVRRRKELQGQLGKWLAMAIATGQVLHEHEPVRLVVDDEPMDVWMLFVGNGLYTPRGGFPASRLRMDDGLLDVQYLRVGQFSRIRAVFAILTGTADHSRVFRGRTATSLSVSSRSGPVDVACDGEPIGPVPSCTFRKLPGHLHVYRPAS